LDPVRIDTSYTSSSVTVRLYGNDMGRRVSAGLSGSASTANGGTVKVTRTIRNPSGTTSTQVWWHKYNPKPDDDSGGGGGGGGGGDPEPDPDPGPGPGPSPD
jgi:hypothetical protein